MRRLFVASTGGALILASAIGLVDRIVFAQSAARPSGSAQAAPAKPAAAKPATPTPTAPPKSLVVPRTPDGRPDLEGNWSFATITPLQRPANFGDRAVLTDQEARQAEEQAARQSNQDAGRQRGSAADVSRAYNDAWYDRGTKVVGTRQTSIIIDPPDGRIPPTTPEAQARAAERATARRGRGPADGPEDRSLAERCLIGFNAGPPLTPSAYNNNIRLVLTHDYVMIMTEMVHEARIVPLDGRPHLPSSVRPWMGDARGHWDGNTLVVETTNFSEKNTPRGASPNLRLTERFTRSDSATLMYEFTFNDPSTWTKPWTGRIPLERLNADEDVYEYACHEGNRGMEGILKGTRMEEQEAAQKK